MENFTKIEAFIAEAKEEAVKFFEKSNKSAGTRLRKSLGEVSKLIKVVKKEVTEKKNELKAAKETSAPAKAKKAPVAKKAITKA